MADINLNGAITGLQVIPEDRIIGVGYKDELFGRQPLVLLYDKGSWLRINTVVDEARLWEVHPLSKGRVLAFGHVEIPDLGTESTSSITQRRPSTWISESFQVPVNARSSMQGLYKYISSDVFPLRGSAWIASELPNIREDADAESTAVARLGRLKKSEADELKESAGWQELAISSVLRIGLIAILFFIAQVFVNLYRYLFRIAVFYEACGKAISLTSDENGQISSIETLRNTIDTLTPDRVDFDQVPKPMIDSLMSKAIKF